MKDFFNRLFKDRSKLIKISFLSLSAVGFLIWICDILAKGRESRQFSIFFNSLGDFFADFSNVVGYSAYGDPYHCMAYTGLSEKGYPPLTYVLLRPFGSLTDMEECYKRNYFLDMIKNPFFLTTAFLCLFIVLLLLFLLIQRKCTGSYRIRTFIALSLIFSRPVLFLAERGNILILCLLFTAYFLFHYDDKNIIRREAAFISLGIAFALKITPAFCGIVLLFDKRFSEALRTAIYGLFFFMLPFLFLEGGFGNIMPMWNNMKLLLEDYNDTVLNSLHKYFYIFVPYFSDSVLNILKYVMCIILIVLCPFYQRKWEKMLAVSLVLVFLPPLSHYYCVTYLIPSAVMFFSDTAHKKRDWFFVFLFLMTFWLPVFPVFDIIPYQTWIMLLMLCLIGLQLFDIFEKKRGEKSAGNYKFFGS